MANDRSADLTHLLNSFDPPQAAFTPCAYYGAEEDALIFYFRPGRDYAKRLNKLVTLYISLDDEELIGCQIKGVRSVLDELGNFNIEVSHRRIKLNILFLAYAGTVMDDPDARIAYQTLARAASESNLEIEVPELV
jgi:hypothetical protein